MANHYISSLVPVCQRPSCTIAPFCIGRNLPISICHVVCCSSQLPLPVVNSQFQLPISDFISRLSAISSRAPLYICYSFPSGFLLILSIPIPLFFFSSLLLFTSFLSLFARDFSPSPHLSLLPISPYSPSLLTPVSFSFPVSRFPLPH